MFFLRILPIYQIIHFNVAREIATAMMIAPMDSSVMRDHRGDIGFQAVQVNP